MFDIKINYSRNAVLCRAVGRFDVAMARAMAEKFKKAVIEVTPGFTVITDMTEFKPMNAETRMAIGEIVQHAHDNGIGRAVRIVSSDPDSQIGGMQLDKESKERGYPVFQVGSYSEAKQVLQWD